MTKDSNMVSPFSFSGELAKTYIKKDKVHYLKLATNQGEYWIKVAKKIRKDLLSLYIGSQIEVVGTFKQHPKTGEVKYKAQTVILIAQSEENRYNETRAESVSLLPVVETETKSQAKILICQKSNCWKKGGKRVCEELESILSDRGIDQEISIKKTGCLKKCKQAPTLVMMPDKARYVKVKPKQVADLIDKHLIK